MELRAGAFRARDRRLLAYREAGDVLRLLQSRHDYRLASRHSIVNDVLIALSARSIGATVVTQNARDYRAIRSIRSFRLELASV